MPLGPRRTALRAALATLATPTVWTIYQALGARHRAQLDCLSCDQQEFGLVTSELCHCLAERGQVNYLAKDAPPEEEPTEAEPLDVPEKIAGYLSRGTGT